MLFLEYPKCSTCIKAKKHLDEMGVKYDDRNIVFNNPNTKELTKWIKQSGLETKKFFNTSGKMYKELGLSSKLKDMSEKEMIELLSTNGMLVKRPILVDDTKVIVGYKIDEYAKLK